MLVGHICHHYICPTNTELIALDNIIGRELEKRELNEAYSSDEAELIAVYGRRRVGKTFLIRQFLQEKKGLYFQTTGIYKGSLEKQLIRFAKELGEAFYQGAAIKVPINWMDAFDELTAAIKRIPKNKRIVLFFDELPWMVTRKSGLVSALEYFWNRYWSLDKRVKLIVCGSAASWIIKKIIKNRGGLHNRVTRIIKLLPFNLNETFLFLKKVGYSCNHQQAIKLYMATGGLPFYLKQIEKSYSVDQNIDRMFFNSSGILFDEFDEVFSSLFEDSEQYKELITLIASHKDGVSRSFINDKNKLTGKGGRLTQRLEDLEEAGFIASFMPYEHKKLGLFYRINDEYCYFYLQWLDGIKNKLKQDRSSKFWKKITNTPEYYNWVEYVFKNICYKHLPQIRKKLELDEFCLSAPWRYQPRKSPTEAGTLIDLLFERDDGAITICEINYTEQPFVIDKSYMQVLQQKIAVFKKVTKAQKQIFLAIISANGVKKTTYSEEMVDGGVVTLDDLFKKED